MNLSTTTTTLASLSTTTTMAPLSTTLDPLIHNMSCEVPHDDQSKVYTYHLSASFVASSTFIAILNFVMAIPCAFTNLLIIFAIIKNEHLQITPYKLLFSICLADLITGAVAQPIFGTHIFQISAADHQCPLSNFMIYIVPVLILVTMVTHAVSALERYCSIHYVKNYEKIFSSRFVAGILLLVWSISSICFVVPFISGKTIVGGRIVIALILVSLAICSYCYISMYQDFKQQFVRTTAKIQGAYIIREEHPVERTADEQQKFQKNIKIASFFNKLYLCMFVIYLLTIVKNILVAYDVTVDNATYTLSFVFDTILFSNAFINPFLIFKFNDEIYACVKDIFS
eukprot:TCONS_00004221-protein